MSFTKEHMNLKYIEKWERPECYAGQTWDDYYVFLGQNRESSCLERSNFDCGLKAIKDLGEVSGDIETRFVVRERHWAVGWVEWIAIHEGDVAALEKADYILKKLDGYPVLNEGHYQNLLDEEAEEVWKRCFSISDRINLVREYRSEFTFHSLADLIGCIRGKFYCGNTDLVTH